MTWEQYKSECARILRTLGYRVEIVENISRSGEKGMVIYGYAEACQKYGTATMTESGIKFISPMQLVGYWEPCVARFRGGFKSRYVPLIPARAVLHSVRKII